MCTTEIWTYPECGCRYHHHTSCHLALTTDHAVNNSVQGSDDDNSPIPILPHTPKACLSSQTTSFLTSPARLHTGAVNGESRHKRQCSIDRVVHFEFLDPVCDDCVVEEGVGDIEMISTGETTSYISLSSRDGWNQAYPHPRPYNGNDHDLVLGCEAYSDSVLHDDELGNAMGYSSPPRLSQEMIFESQVEIEIVDCDDHDGENYEYEYDGDGTRYDAHRPIVVENVGGCTHDDARPRIGQEVRSKNKSSSSTPPSQRGRQNSPDNDSDADDERSFHIPTTPAPNALPSPPNNVYCSSNYSPTIAKQTKTHDDVRGCLRTSSKEISIRRRGMDISREELRLRIASGWSEGEKRGMETFKDMLMGRRAWFVSSVKESEVHMKETEATKTVLDANESKRRLQMKTKTTEEGKQKEGHDHEPEPECEGDSSRGRVRLWAKDLKERVGKSLSRSASRVRKGKKKKEKKNGSESVTVPVGPAWMSGEEYKDGNLRQRLDSATCDRGSGEHGFGHHHYSQLRNDNYRPTTEVEVDAATAESQPTDTSWDQHLREDLAVRQRSASLHYRHRDHHDRGHLNLVGRDGDAETRAEAEIERESQHCRHRLHSESSSVLSMPMTNLSVASSTSWPRTTSRLDIDSGDFEHETWWEFCGDDADGTVISDEENGSL